MDSQISSLDFCGLFRRYCSCPYLIPLFRKSDLPGDHGKTSLKGRIGLTFTHILPCRTQALEEVALSVYGTLARLPLCAPEGSHGPRKLQKLLLKKILLFIPLSNSCTQSPFYRLALFLLCLNASSVSFSISPALPILPLLLLFSVDFQSLIVALHIIFSRCVSSSIHYSPSLISQSPFYLGGKWLRKKTSFVLFCFQDKENQGPGRKGICPRPQQVSTNEDRGHSAPMKTMSLTGPMHDVRYINQFPGSNQAPQISE